MRKALESMLDKVQEVLAQRPGATKRELLPALREAGVELDDFSELNRFLYGHREAWRETRGEFA